jgi:hypothetical protein
MLQGGQRSKPGASGSRSEPGCVKPRLPSLENLLSFCQPDLDRWHRIQMVKGGRRSTCVAGNIPASSGKTTSLPGRLALVRPAPGFAMLARAKHALHTLIRRRHLTPSCGGRVPTAENPGPGKDVRGELDHRPGIRGTSGKSAGISRESLVDFRKWHVTDVRRQPSLVRFRGAKQTPPR